MNYTVTRQSNYYDEGALSVEVARAFDYSGPGALVAKYADEFGEWEDPREAAEAAIRIRSEWHRDGAREDESGRLLHFTFAGNGFCYATVADGMSAAKLRRFARKEWEALPKCEVCGSVADEEDNWRDEYGDKFTACSQMCADRYCEPYDEDDES